MKKIKKILLLSIGLILSQSISSKEYRSADVKSIKQNSALDKEEIKEQSQDKELYIQDKILAVIYHPEEKVVITKSDLRPHLDGRPKTLDKVILNELIILDAKALKFDQNVTDQDVDQTLEKLQKEHNMSRDDFENIFKDLGYDWKQGRHELKKMQLADTMMHYRIKDKIIVEKSEIQDYYDKNPMYEEATLKVAKTVIPFYKTDKSTKEEKVAKVDNLIKSGEILSHVTWDEHFDLKDSELAEDKKYIKDLPKDSVVKLKVDSEGITLLHLKDKSKTALLPLEKREKEIGSLLRKQKYETAIKEYEDQLKKQSTIVYK